MDTDPRTTVVSPDDVVVLLIGMRVNRWRDVRAWLPVAAAMPLMLRELERADPAHLARAPAAAPAGRERDVPGRRRHRGLGAAAGLARRRPGRHAAHRAGVPAGATSIRGPPRLNGDPGARGGTVPPDLAPLGGSRSRREPS
ncbi:MAG: DUF4188 domain-containing protein [Actinomycetota bacterium]|nr:DUF4188 domain-containing protein [Actinomycetota bacterium]